MKSKLFLLGVSLILLSSCSNDLDASLSLLTDQDKAPLNVHVVNIHTKAEESSALLPNNSEIGIFVTKSDGSDYKSEIPYNNIKYTGTGSTYASSWIVDQKTPVYLSAEKATAYAYYPRQTSGVSLTSIPITNDGTDWLYSTPVEDLDINNSTANFTMQHAMSIIRINIQGLTDSDHGSVSTVSIFGDGCATGGILNLKTGTIGNFTGIGSQMVQTNVGTIGATTLTCEQWVVPTSITKDIQFWFTIDNQVYNSYFSEVTLLSGKQYNFNLTFSNSVGLSINSVSVTDWEETNFGELETNIPLDTWEQVKTLDGVYGIKSDGRPLKYSQAITSNESLIGVAFVVEGKAYQVAKVDAPGHSGSGSVCWWNKKDSKIAGLIDYSYADNSYDFGYLPYPDGSYGGERHLDDDWTKWSTYSNDNAALSDFKGKENTELIIAAQTKDGGLQTYTLGKAVVDFRGDASVNEGHDDWFVPACGELAFMYLKKKELYTLLRKVSGEEFWETHYWSSSQDYWVNSAWVVYMKNGYVNAINGYKSGNHRLRLVRAL